MGKRKILIVEDDKKIAELLSDYLEQANFNVSMLKRGDTVISEVRMNPPDVILLDLMLPGKDGMTICREIRSFSKVPILMLTAKVEEIDRLLGLELGADDYICKPFSPREVVARIKAVMRRSNPEPTEESLVAGPITINPDSHKATVGEADLRLTPNEFELLKVLISRPGRVFTRSDLVSKIQGYDFDGYDRTIDSHIKNLRKKIDELLPGNKIIQTVYGIGYSLTVPQSGNLIMEQ
jgi:two-component system, OmpR family, response regulator BaeR